MTYIFIDTNVCLHFIQFDKYSWRKQFPNELEICIVITHPLIEELDKKKYSGLSHLKQRAISSLKTIEKIALGESIPEIKALLFNENINKEFVTSLGLDYNDGDDRMLSAIVKFKSTINDSNKIYFVTNDLGPRLKSGKFNIQSYAPDEKFQIQSPVDELEKNIKQLKIENEKLKNLSPKLSVSFKNKEDKLKIKILNITSEREHFIKTELRKNKTDYPRFILKTETNEIDGVIKKNDLDQIKNLREMMSNSFGISEEAKEQYNSDLEFYQHGFESYLDELYDYKIKKSLTVEINFELNNIGTVPADDIDIYIHFPDGFELFNSKDYPKEPNIPAAPDKPRSMFDYNHKYNLPNLYFPNNRDFSIAEKPNVSSATIKKSNSYDVDIKVHSLKHNKTATLEPLFIIFENYDSVINFNIEYELRCSNIPEVVKGNLNAIIEV